MEERPTKRKLQALNTKNKIFETAVRLLKEGRFDQMKVEDICKEANVSIGSFYNSYPSKNDIYIDIYMVADEYFKNAAASVLNSGDIIDRIIQFFAIYAEYNKSQGVEFIRNLYNVDNRLFISKGRPMQRALLGIIEEGQKSGRLKTGFSSEEIVNLLFVCARGIMYDWCLHHGSYELTDKFNRYMSHLIMSFDNG